MEAAKFLGYTVQHTRLLIRCNKLKAEKIGGVWFILKTDLNRFNSFRRMSSLIASTPVQNKRETQPQKSLTVTN